MSDDGEVLLAAPGDDSVVSYRAGRSPEILLRGGGIVAVDFFPGSRDALVAGASAVWTIRDSNALLVADDRDGIADPVGIAGSIDGARAFIVLRSGQVIVRDLAGSAQTIVSCDCRPSGLARLRGAAVFRLNEIGDGPVWLLDADGPAPRIVFVAAAAGSEQ